MMKNQLAGLMKQAQQMQDNMKKAQEELALTEVEGQSGAGLVKVVMTCRHDVKRVSIDPSLLADDRDMLEDLVAAAVNDAVRRVESTTQEKMSGLTAGLPLRRFQVAVLSGQASFPRANRRPPSTRSRARLALPAGRGPKAAQRMALHLMQHDRDGARALGAALTQAADRIRHCERCNTFTEDAICALCRSPRRDPSLLCVVETPADLLMVEHAQAYRASISC